MKLALDIVEQTTVPGPIESVFETLLGRMAEGSLGSETPMPMVLERRPGGRWYRDLGNDAGHLWGHVQSFRPPDLIEVYGPLFMSLPVANNLIIRLEETDAGVDVTLKHKAHGPLEDEWEDGVREGWSDFLSQVRRDCDGA